MADITMCQNSLCPSAGGCYRYMARPNDLRQSYFWGNPDSRGHCDKYWPIETWTSGDTVEAMAEGESDVENP